uniref:Calponin-homology (CH) domain-containing protein n=1 Tax=Heterorhabditis bacteriophora TaxID=37862 RepID=A0A1I7WT30_HETBA
MNETKTSESIDTPKTKYESQFQAINDSLQECKRLSQPELVAELKQRGTYNPELMAWDALGVIRFLDRTIHDHYQKQPASKNKQRTEEVVERNVEALANLLKELNISCDVTTPVIREKLHNITFTIIQAIRRLPDNFFPPFINEVTCDSDKACLYFYDYLKFLSLIKILSKNFSDEMSFFAKYV